MMMSGLIRTGKMHERQRWEITAYLFDQTFQRKRIVIISDRRNVDLRRLTLINSVGISTL